MEMHCRWRRIVWLLLLSLLISEEKRGCSYRGTGLGFLISKQGILWGKFCLSLCSFLSFWIKHNLIFVSFIYFSFLECGVLFIYPEFSTLSEYQLLMEVILDEIGWLNFYAAYNNQLRQERRRSKHPPIHAEKEITLHAVFTVCYDVILGYAHCSNSSHQALGADLINFLLKRWKKSMFLLVFSLMNVIRPLNSINFLLFFLVKQSSPSFYMFGGLLDGLWWNRVSLFDTIQFKKTRSSLSFCEKNHICTFSGSEMQRIGEKNALDLTPSIWMKDDKSSLVVDTWYNRPAEMNKIEQHIQEHQV